MKKTVRYFDVAPLIVEAGKKAVVRIKPRFKQAALPPESEFQVRIAPAMGATAGGRHLNHGQMDHLEPVKWKLKDGVLELEAYFHDEQEHLIFVDKPDGTPIRTFNIYSLKPDLYKLRPFKGDFHIHTTGSDGQECPEYVAARYREGGFDFIAISDHHKYEPSLQAIDYWKQYRTGLKLYPGEEVHPPDCPVHMVNFGGSFSVNEIFRKNEKRFRREVEKRIPGLGAVTPGVDPFAVAATEWCFDKIREGGGLAVYCHPYWDIRGWNAISGALADEVFKRRKFDAFEMIGGYWKHQSDSNLYQVVRCYEEWAQGGAFPVVGLSDSHGTDRDGLFSWYYTLVLAKSDKLEDLVAAIRAGNSVAVDAPADERAHCLGSYRLVRYTQFLLREYFPRHQWLCRTEGEAMQDLLGGEETLAKILPVLGRRSAEFRRSAFKGSSK